MSNMIEAGDRVVDPLDGEVRLVVRVEGTTLHLDDGGVMGIDEPTRVYLPSEVIDLTPLHDAFDEYMAELDAADQYDIEARRRALIADADTNLQAADRASNARDWRLAAKHFGAAALAYQEASKLNAPYYAPCANVCLGLETNMLRRARIEEEAKP